MGGRDAVIPRTRAYLICDCPVGLRFAILPDEERVAMKGRTIVVTGAGGVLGGAVARAAAAKGAQVVLVDVGPLPQGDGLRISGVDLTDFTAAKRAMDEAAARTGGIDALCNIAGGFRWQTLQDGGVDAWDALYAINLKTAVVASKAALPHLLARLDSSIVNVGALGALKAGAGMGAYAASKAGVAKLTESLAEELKGRVRVNAVLPSIIDTPANRKDMPDADFSKWVTPDELAAVVLFLAGADASAVTGALVPVPGRV
jgi:NAD(P)-dependent dehydrogenase (short-subunit alcohol dehydrogenase family)